MGLAQPLAEGFRLEDNLSGVDNTDSHRPSAPKRLDLQLAGG